MFTATNNIVILYLFLGLCSLGLVVGSLKARWQQLACMGLDEPEFSIEGHAYSEWVFYCTNEA